MTELRELIECAEVLLQAHRFDEALPVCEEMYVLITQEIRNSALQNNYLMSIPGEPYMQLYLGHSEQLGAYKIGISADAHKRAQSIRSENARHGHGRDFELLDCVSGPATSVRKAESRIKQHYAHAALMGTEWFGDYNKDFEDDYWCERDWLFGECERVIKEFDPLAQLDRESALAIASWGPVGALRRLEAIERKIKLWHREYDLMTEYVRQEVRGV